MKDKMLLLNYRGKEEEEQAVEEILQKGCRERPTADTPVRLLERASAGGLAMSEGGSDSLDTADTCCANEEEVRFSTVLSGCFSCLLF